MANTSKRLDELERNVNKQDDKVLELSKTLSLRVVHGGKIGELPEPKNTIQIIEHEESTQ